MSRTLRIPATVLALALGGAIDAAAQTPSQPDPRKDPTAPPVAAPESAGDRTTRTAYRPSQYPRDFFPPIPTDPSHPEYYAPAHRSIIRHNPLPYSSERSYGYRNPGGVGRSAEYYPPGNQFEGKGGDPVKVAGFDTGPGNRQEQFQAQSLGIQRANSLQYQIQAYSTPGYGLGYGGGLFYSFPR